MNQKKDDTSKIRGDQVSVDDVTGAITSDYLTNTKEVLKKLNKVSNCMCLAKWYYSSINLTTGKTQSCYHPPAHDILAIELETNSSALHNTKFKKNQRSKMLKGERPSECQYCWNIEDVGAGEQLSDRAYRSADFFTEELLEEAVKLGSEGNPNPRFLEIVFSNQCNLKCSYCSPHQSTAWYEDVSKNGPYRLQDHAHNDLRGLAWLGLLPSPEKTKKYVEAFWSWWPELYTELKHLKISGGEPLLDENTYKVFDYVLKNPKKDLQLMLMSNCNPPEQLWKKFLSQVIEMAKQNAFDHFMLFYSLDAWGEKAAYIRNGLNFSHSLQNVENFLQSTEKTSVTITSTFNVFSVFSFKEFLEGVLALRQKYSSDRQKIWIDFPALSAPEWMSIKILPKECAGFIQEGISFVEKNLESKDTRFKGFKDFELEKIKTIYSQMINNEENEKTFKLRKDFKKFFAEQDKRSGKNLLEVFPEMKSVISLI